MYSFLAEFLGTFVFLTVILASPNAISIGAALAVAILAFGAISGGHFNPAVSFMMLMNGKIKVDTFLMYVIAQVLGGVIALFMYRAATGKKLAFFK